MLGKWPEIKGTQPTPRVSGLTTWWETYLQA